MFKCSISSEEKPDFLPFTLNMKLTTKESAHNLFKLLQPIIYCRPHLEGGGEVKLVGINRERRQMAEDICNIISQSVVNIRFYHEN